MNKIILASNSKVRKKILDKNNLLKRKIIKNATGVENFKAL